MSKVRGGAIVAAVLAVVMLASITEATAAEPAGAAATAERTQGLTQKDAKAYIARYLKHSARRYWQLGHDKKIYDCKNLSPIRVRCRVSWYYKEKYFIHGSATAYYKPTDPEHVYLRRNLKVKRI